ncbi:MAG: nickel pincer cofactor biosynthesis protein LarB [Bacillota bacterium]|nr:nickel pincer cofactor biosynthesis protein LarB [Bacillota bacterium]
MLESDIRALLEKVKSGETGIAEAAEKLKTMPFEDLGFAMVDNHRALRKGFAEAVFCEGKTDAQVAAIVKCLLKSQSGNILLTRARRSLYEKVKHLDASAVYHKEARIIEFQRVKERKKGKVAVISAGTADIPVAEEAAVTAESMGSCVERLYDVGVAGIHRLLMSMDRLKGARAVVAAAGMEGALPSVIAGLVDVPVIALPTSVGYGASLGGLAALLAMLNSCANGVAVVNIDNGFGAGCLAHMINLSGEAGE